MITLRRWMWTVALTLSVTALTAYFGAAQRVSETAAGAYGYVAMGWLEEAARQLQEAARRRPDDPEALLLAGIALQAVGDTEGGVIHLRAAAERGSLPALWALVGEAYLEKGDLLRAEEAYRKALAVDAELALALRGLGRIAEMRGDVDAAKGHYRAALKAAAGLPDVHYRLGVLLAEERDWEGALTHLQRASQMKPRDADIHWRMAEVYHALGERERAERALRRALQLNPHHQGAARMLRLLYPGQTER